MLGNMAHLNSETSDVCNIYPHFTNTETDTEWLSKLLKIICLLSGGVRTPILVFQVELILIHGFCICTFAYFLKFACCSKINTHSTFLVLYRPVQNGKKPESPIVHIPSCG